MNFSLQNYIEQLDTWLIILCLFRKKFTDKENQSVLQKLREELKSLNPAISFTDVRGKSIEPVHSIMKTNHMPCIVESQLLTNFFSTLHVVFFLCG